jgi:hypothetical protein
VSQIPTSPPEEEHFSSRLEGSSVKGQPLQGEVRAFREFRHPDGSINPVVWTFRLERFQDGVPMTPIMVEMRGAAFKGFINEGDTVVIYDPWQEGAVLETRQVFNKTAGIEVRALSWFETTWDSLGTLARAGSPAGLLVKGLILLVLLLVLAAICIMVYTWLRFSSGVQGFEQLFCELAPVC